MNSKISIALILGLSMSSAMATKRDPNNFKYGPEACSVIPFDFDVTKIYETNCDSSRENEVFCKCLNAQIEKNDLFKGIKHDMVELSPEEKNRVRKLYVNKILNVYSQLNYGVASQEAIYGMRKKDEKVAGCSPKDLTEKFQFSLAHPNVSGQTAGIAAEDFSKVNAEQMDKKIEELNKQWAKEMPSTQEVFKINQAMGSACNMTADPKLAKTRIPEKMKFSTLDAIEVQDPAAAKVLREEYLKSLKEMQTFFEANPKLLTSFSLEKIQQMVETADSVSNCDPGKVQYNSLVREYNFKSQLFPKSQQVLTADSIGLKADLETKNVQVEQELELGYDRLLPEACITYKNFQVINSAPDKDLLSLFNRGNAENFNMANESGETASPVLKFLRRNPVLAKIAADPGGRVWLADNLKQLSDGISKDAGEAERVGHFSKFMSTKVADYSKDKSLYDFDKCQQLAENLAAVFLSDKLPPIPTAGDNELAGITNSILRCHNYERGEPTEVEKTLHENPLFLILGKTNEAEGITFGPESDPEYKAFIAERCKGFAAFRDKEVGKCSHGLFRNTEACLSKYTTRKKGKSKKLLEEYYAEVNPELGKVVNASNINSFNPDSKSIAARTDSSRQDTEAKSYYNEVVRPKLKRGVLPSSKGSYSNEVAMANADLAAQQEKYQKKVSNEQNVKSTFAASNEIKANENQIQPEAAEKFVSPASIVPPPVAVTPANLSSASTVNRFLNQDPSLTSTEKLEDLKDKETQISEKMEEMIAKEKSPAEKENLKEKKDDFLTELQEKKDDALREIARASSKNDGGRAPASLPAVAPAATTVAVVGNFGNNVGNFTAPAQSSRAISSKSASKTDYNKAVLSMYSSKDGSVSVANKYANIPATKEGAEVVTALKLKPEEFNAILKAESLKDISNELQKHLRQPYPNGVISVPDPNSSMEMFFLVTPSTDGKSVVVKLVPAQTKVQPKAKRKYKKEFLDQAFKSI